MTRLLTTAALAALIALPAAAQTVRMGTEGAYPPYNFINDNGEVDGFERELGDELCARAQLECVWVTNEWDSIIPNLVAGNYDTIIAGMSITPERDEVIDFTQAYKPSESNVFVAAAGAGDEATTGVVAAQVNTIQSGWLAEQGVTLLEFATPDETIAAVRNGEADAVFANLSFLGPVVNESGGELEIVGEPIRIAEGVGMGLRESDTELKATFDAAITSMKEDGSLNELLKKWFESDAELFE